MVLVTVQMVYMTLGLKELTWTLPSVYKDLSMHNDWPIENA